MLEVIQLRCLVHQGSREATLHHIFVDYPCYTGSVLRQAAVIKDEAEIGCVPGNVRMPITFSA
jgi:hypothetical protein